MNAIGEYLTDIGDVDFLTREEEIALAKRYEKGDEEAGHAIMHRCLPYVVHIAKKYEGRGIDLEDLIQEGNTGLVEAMKEFDPERGTRFSTYATFWIRKNILHAIAESARVIRIPRYLISFDRKCASVRIKLAHALNREPTDDEIRKDMGLTEKEYDRKKRLLESARSPMNVTFKGVDGRDFGNAAVFDVETIQERHAEGETLSLLRKRLSSLSKEKRTLLALRFGLGKDQEPQTQKRTAESMGLISKNVVAPIEQNALSELRRLFYNSDPRSSNEMKPDK